MRKAFASSQYIALFFVLCCLAFTAAHAGTVFTYSDLLICDGNSPCPSNGFIPPSQPIVNYEVAGVFYGPTLGPPAGVVGVIATLDLSATVSNFYEQTSCSPICITFWGGDFSKGIVTVDAVILYSDLSTRDIQFAGLINNGEFSEVYSENCGFSDCGSEFIDFTFSGRWSNGWQSTATANVVNELGQGGSGSLLLSTQTPEPASLTLLGSGILGVAGVLRRRLGR